MSRLLQRGNAALIAIVVVLAVAIIGVLGFLFWKNFLSVPAADTSNISNFAECKAAVGSIIQESYPETCITAGGQSFTGPLNGEVEAELATYCAPAEKVCFDYPDTWSIVQNPVENVLDEGLTADSFYVQDADANVKLLFQSGIDGIGGYCSEDSARPVYVLSSSTITAMTGFGSEFSIDTLKVARVIVEFEDGKYNTAIYATSEEAYTEPGLLSTCGVMFSHLITGRNAKISVEHDDAGAFRFGVTGNDEDARVYDSLEKAEEAFDTEEYVVAAAILASMRYE